MARIEQHMDASPDEVFGVLADPRGYAYWVIGSIKIREADDAWPAEGTRFHHTVGMGPLRVQDHTRVERVEPGRFLQLETKARPLGNARVKLELQAENGGTRVTMTEDPADKPTAFVFMPLTHLLLRGRNLRSLERLAELAEGRRAIPAVEDGDATNPEAERRHRQILPLAAAGALLAGGAAAAFALLRRR
jgi:uncharacterized protein YndB with AHSA1/START domain